MAPNPFSRVLRFLGEVDGPAKLSDRFQKQKKDGDQFMEDPSTEDLVIPLMGPTGVGKSTFINNYLADIPNVSKAIVGHDLESCTRVLDWYTATLPPTSVYPGRRLVLVDTPGFDDTYADDSEILRRIAVWLAKSYFDGMTLAGVIYLHDINQKRMFGSTRMNLNMFEQLVGPKAFPTVALVTTQWDTVNRQVGEAREQELRETFWENAIKSGASVLRVDTDSPHKVVVETILKRHYKATAQHQVMRIQTELVVQEKIIPMTDAGQQLRYSLEQLLEIQKQIAENAEDDTKREELIRRQALIKGQIDQVSASLASKVSATVSRFMRSIFSPPDLNEARGHRRQRVNSSSSTKPGMGTASLRPNGSASLAASPLAQAHDRATNQPSTASSVSISRDEDLEYSPSPEASKSQAELAQHTSRTEDLVSVPPPQLPTDLQAAELTTKTFNVAKMQDSEGAKVEESSDPSPSRSAPLGEVHPSGTNGVASGHLTTAHTPTEGNGAPSYTDENPPPVPSKSSQQSPSPTRRLINHDEAPPSVESALPSGHLPTTSNPTSEGDGHISQTEEMEATSERPPPSEPPVQSPSPTVKLTTPGETQAPVEKPPTPPPKSRMQSPSRTRQSTDPGEVQPSVESGLSPGHTLITTNSTEGDVPTSRAEQTLPPHAFPPQPLPHPSTFRHPGTPLKSNGNEDDEAKDVYGTAPSSPSQDELDPAGLNRIPSVPLPAPFITSSGPAPPNTAGGAVVESGSPIDEGWDRLFPAHESPAAGLQGYPSVTSRGSDKLDRRVSKGAKASMLKKSQGGIPGETNPSKGGMFSKAKKKFMGGLRSGSPFQTNSIHLPSSRDSSEERMPEPEAQHEGPKTEACSQPKRNNAHGWA